MNLELAKKIIIEFFSTGRFRFDRNQKELIKEINEFLIEREDEYLLSNGNSLSYEGWSGIRITKLDDWIDYVNSFEGDIMQINNTDKVFYNIDGKLTLFIIEEAC